MVAGAPTFKDIAVALSDLTRDRVIIGHGVAYDLAVLRREYALAGVPMPRWRPLDTLDLGGSRPPHLPITALIASVNGWACRSTAVTPRSVMRLSPARRAVHPVTAAQKHSYAC